MRAGVQTPAHEPPPPGNFLRQETMTKRIERFAITVMLLLFLVSAFVAVYFWGRSTVEVPVIDATKARIVSRVVKHQLTEEQLALFDKVYELIGQGSPIKAEEFLAAELKKEPSLPFASYLLGWLKLMRGKRVEALPLLDASVERGEAVTPALLALARSYRGKVGKVNLRNRHYKDAMQSDPIDYLAFFNYGEALRSQGRSSEAVDRLRAALNRAHFEAAYPIVETKLALARLEAGDESIADELHAAVVEDPPRGNMMVAAAVLALQQDKPDEAARLLEKARSILPPRLFRTLIVDQAFALSRDRPEMRGLF